jgi:hypothetical protein
VLKNAPFPKSGIEMVSVIANFYDQISKIKEAQRV